MNIQFTKFVAFYFFLLAPAFSQDRTEESLEKCLDRIETKLVAGQIESLNAEYGKIHENYVKNNPRSARTLDSEWGLKKDIKPILLKGTNDQKAVMLLHGFTSSPFEVQDIGETLNKEGFTVYMPVVWGFGSSTIIANQATIRKLELQTQNYANLILACYPKITLGGFSMGGAIVTQYLLSALESKNQNRVNSIDSVFLLAPYFKTKIPFEKLGAGVVGFFADSIPMATVGNSLALLDPSNGDLSLPLKYPEHYNTDLPLQAVKMLTTLGKEVRGRAQEIVAQRISLKYSPRIFLSYSDSDKSIDKAEAVAIAKNLNQSVTEFHIDAAVVPHQIGVRAVNPFLPDLTAELVHFLKYSKQ